jgi:hypothetical protein
MNLFNQSMSRLSSTNDSFINLLAEQGTIMDEINFLKGLIYTQTDLNTINAKITNLESLLRLYSTNQMVSSDTVLVNSVPGTPPTISLSTISTNYERIYVYSATDMYNTQGIIPINLSVPNNRDFSVSFTNNDEVELVLENNDNLTFVFDRDLYFKQSVDIIIDSNEFSTQNKMLDIYMNSDISNTTNQTTEVLLIGSINLPIFYNDITQQQNSAYLWKDFKFDIDLSTDKSININVGSILEIPINSLQNLVTNSIKPGDTLYLNNFFVGTQSIYDFSGQYTVQSVPLDKSYPYLSLNISSNQSLVNYGASASLPLSLNNQLSNIPFFSLNKGKKIKITRISNSTVLKERYTINIEDIR